MIVTFPCWDSVIEIKQCARVRSEHDEIIARNAI